jgi:hypothetical protein
MTTGTDSVTPDLEVWSNSMILPGVWYSVVVYVEPRYNVNGHLRLWINGVRYADWTGYIGYDPNQIAGAYNGLDVKNGIYQPGVNNGHTFYFDQIKFETDLGSIPNTK